VKIQEKIQLGRTQKNPVSFGFGSFQFFGFRFGSGSKFLGSSSGSVLRKNLGSGFGSGSVPSSGKNWREKNLLCNRVKLLCK
jgi:hypothetical protein